MFSDLVLAEEQSPASGGGGEELVQTQTLARLLQTSSSLLDFQHFLNFLATSLEDHLSHNLIQVKLAIKVAEIRKITYLCED